MAPCRLLPRANTCAGMRLSRYIAADTSTSAGKSVLAHARVVVLDAPFEVNPLAKLSARVVAVAKPPVPVDDQLSQPVGDALTELASEHRKLGAIERRRNRDVRRFAGHPVEWQLGAVPELRR